MCAFVLCILVKIMDVGEIGSVVVGRHGVLTRELMLVDAQLSTATGSEQTRLSRRRSEILGEMVQLWILQGYPDIARHLEEQRSAPLTGTVALTTESEQRGGSEWVGNVEEAGALRMHENEETDVSENGAKKRKHDEGGRGRLANVAPQTPDQVNDKKVIEKSWQVDRAYVQLETMTTPESEEGKNFPRHNSVIITVTECRANVGGGNRTRVQSLEGKRRYHTVAAMRTTRNSMTADGTMKAALFAAAKKMTKAESMARANYWEELERQEPINVGVIRLAVSVALSWKVQQRNAFREEWTEVDESEKKEEDSAMKTRGIRVLTGSREGREWMGAGDVSTEEFVAPISELTPRWPEAAWLPQRLMLRSGSSTGGSVVGETQSKEKRENN